MNQSQIVRPEKLWGFSRLESIMRVPEQAPGLFTERLIVAATIS
jgi:hypothetical protein